LELGTQRVRDGLLYAAVKVAWKWCYSKRSLNKASTDSTQPSTPSLLPLNVSLCPSVSSSYSYFFCFLLFRVISVGKNLV